VPKLVSTLAAATVGAIGLYIPAIGLFGPLDACVHTASAAPSPSCSSDLRECLHLSAKTGIYGARYVTAEDVARCVETFNACIHGGATAGGNPVLPPTSTSAGNGGRRGLPERFELKGDFGVVSDCRVSGESITCKESWNAVGEGVESDTSTVTGTLTGLTMTGTREMRRIGHVPSDPTCGYTEDHSIPVTYRFSPDGTVAMSNGPGQWKITHTGSCSYLSPDTGTSASGDATGMWSAIG
jgi:hypothetical protein